MDLHEGDVESCASTYARGTNLKMFYYGEKLKNVKNHLQRSILANPELETYASIWDIVIHHDAIQGQQPEFADLSNQQRAAVFQKFSGYRVARNVLFPVQQSVEVERVYWDEEYRAIKSYVQSLWIAAAHATYEAAKTKKTVTANANPEVGRSSIYTTVRMIPAAHALLTDINDLPSPHTAHTTKIHRGALVGRANHYNFPLDDDVDADDDAF